jgi:tyrosine-protein phosphatase SIW14
MLHILRGFIAVQSCRYGVLAFAFIAIPVFAGSDVAGVPNFHQVNNQVYRGAQPANEGFKSLAKLGVKTVIDLRESGGRSVAEQKVVEAQGMRYISIPFKGMSAPTVQQMEKVLQLLNDNGSLPVFIHCRRGADRTGTVVACYRVSHDHWENGKALAEAKSCGMSWMEVAMRDFVLHYKAPAMNLIPAVPAAIN